ncbi:ATP-binding cassette domain-containing protein [Streptomyces albireticuli]|nr:ATP-binding cassette domain-containing protein [Streptomyces albireticuli]MCD9141152.1 ATP-binding cassette domain-containing protein [Streptomyces albireticuli]MCD9160887.1 ATP-binding cassette domain-containing protein [Streptomyces albireticuli]MCD9191056.1 ATP-binding cassette domain-containing protein [Streptomyces albireticuli]
MAEIRDLRVEIGGRAVVDGVGLTVRPGRVTALVGASGSGKTTTGLALLGEYPDGARVTGDVWVAEGPVGYVPQHPASVLNPARRVGALLTDIARTGTADLPRRARRAAGRARVLAALEAARLPDGAEVLTRYPHQLSGGQQQRVVLAQALLLGARTVVADEPTTGLDALTRRRVAGELAAVARRGVAVLLLSHDLDLVRDLADEVLVMRAGRVVESGPAEELWLRPRHPWTRELLGGPGGTADGGQERGRPRTPAVPAPGPVTAPLPVTVPLPVAVPLPAPDPAPAPARDTVEGPAPVLEARAVTARHRGTPALLRDASLSVRAGECLAVVGRSGGGKTTLARCLAGLHSRYEGQVLLDGAPLPRSLRRRDRAQLAAVQYVFQDARAAFDAYRPVLDQVARTAVRLRGVRPGAAEEEAVAALGRVGLSEGTARRRPGGLSGGELQRAALVRALLARPRVLICDEVTSGLDSVTRRGVLRLLADLAREPAGPALVLITHDLDTAALADRIAVLDAGAIVEQGPAAEALTAPRHPFTRALTGSPGAHGPR